MLFSDIGLFFYIRLQIIDQPNWKLRLSLLVVIDLVSFQLKLSKMICKTLTWSPISLDFLVSF